jgi:hypothetical protein
MARYAARNVRARLLPRRQVSGPTVDLPWRSVERRVDDAVLLRERLLPDTLIEDGGDVLGGDVFGARRVRCHRGFGVIRR